MLVSFIIGGAVTIALAVQCTTITIISFGIAQVQASTTLLSKTT